MNENDIILICILISTCIIFHSYIKNHVKKIVDSINTESKENKEKLWEMYIGTNFKILDVYKVNKQDNINLYTDSSNRNIINDKRLISRYRITQVFLNDIEFVDMYLYLEEQGNNIITIEKQQQICDHIWSDIHLCEGWAGLPCIEATYVECTLCNKKVYYKDYQKYNVPVKEHRKNV